jgi:hypothetical protein
MRDVMRKGIGALLLFLRENRRTSLTVLSIFILADIFFVKANSDYVIFTSLLVYVLFMKIFRINSRLTISLCLALLVLMSFDYLFTGASVSTEKAAVWSILFLIIGAVQKWKE